MPAARSPLETAAVLGLLHAVVDAASVGVVFAEFPAGRLPPEQVTLLILGYNAVAFGLQPAIGLAADRLRRFRGAALAGLLLLLAGLGSSVWQPYLAAALVALGNALFHVGAGAIVLERSPGRATEPGVFVAPGALGLTTGVWLGTLGFPFRWLMALALAASMAVVWLHRVPAPRAAAAPGATGGLPARVSAGLTACVALLSLSVVVRSLVGDAVSSTWSQVPVVVLALTAAAVAGKALGGAAADRLGWRLLAVGAMVFAMPLVILARAYPSAAVLESLLVQLTMAVTLAGVFTAMPGRPGTSFGLLSLALLLGAAPGFARSFWPFDPSPILRPALAAAALMLWFGLGPVAPAKRYPAVQTAAEHGK